MRAWHTPKRLHAHGRPSVCCTRAPLSVCCMCTPFCSPLCALSLPVWGCCVLTPARVGLLCVCACPCGVVVCLRLPVWGCYVLAPARVGLLFACACSCGVVMCLRLPVWGCCVLTPARVGLLFACACPCGVVVCLRLPVWGCCVLAPVCLMHPRAQRRCCCCGKMKGKLRCMHVRTRSTQPLLPRQSCTCRAFQLCPPSVACCMLRSTSILLDACMHACVRVWGLGGRRERKPVLAWRVRPVGRQEHTPVLAWCVRPVGQAGTHASPCMAREACGAGRNTRQSLHGAWCRGGRHARWPLQGPYGACGQVVESRG